MELTWTWVISPWCPSADCIWSWIMPSFTVLWPRQCSLWEYTTQDHSNLRSHSPVTATERTVRMREKEGYMQNYTGATCRQGILYSGILIKHIAIRATLQVSEASETKNWATNLQYCQENTVCSSANSVFYVFTIVLSLNEEEGVKEVSNYFSGQELFLIFTKYLQRNKSTETFSG